jgi:hypothetical protein
VPNLSQEEQTAKDFCAGNEDYQDNLVNGIKATSLFGESTCFREGKDAESRGSFAQCVAHSQETAQSGYIIFILLFCPVQLVAAYVGWVLPEIYFNSKEMEKERGFDMDDSVKFVNPLGGEGEEPDPIAQMKSVASAQEKARAAYRLKTEGQSMEGKLPSSPVSRAPIISKAEADRLFIKRGKTLKVALLTDKPDQKLGLVVDRNARCPPRISKVTPNGLAHERKLKAGWAILEVQGKLVEGDGYDECVAAIKNVDYHLGAGLQLTVMLPPGEEFEGDGESVSESDDEETERTVAAKRDAQRKVEQERAERVRAEKERVEANRKRKLEQERKQKEAEKKAKEAAKEAERLKHEEEKKAKEAAKEAERLRHEEEKKARAAVKEVERLKREEEKKAKAEAKAKAAAEKKKQQEETQNVAQEAAEETGTRFENSVQPDADNSTVALDKGGGKRYKVLLPGVIRSGKDLTSEKIGNLHPPEEIVSPT